MRKSTKELLGGFFHTIMEEFKKGKVHNRRFSKLVDNYGLNSHKSLIVKFLKENFQMAIQKQHDLSNMYFIPESKIYCKDFDSLVTKYEWFLARNNSNSKNTQVTVIKKNIALGSKIYYFDGLEIRAGIIDTAKLSEDNSVDYFIGDTKLNDLIYSFELETLGNKIKQELIRKFKENN